MNDDKAFVCTLKSSEKNVVLNLNLKNKDMLITTNLLTFTECTTTSNSIRKFDNDTISSKFIFL